eukprot:TRINITY_DN22908_c2_g1_i2.p1 TRINITY_DN22908_c2_g1~~TRINITY_DN22908_c2_g1_i2.p1  ORF type:complete len:134 (-),score=7.92 TRINITY_DN22908_c2_g1_i2:595-996(-)
MCKVHIPIILSSFSFSTFLFFFFIFTFPLSFFFSPINQPCLVVILKIYQIHCSLCLDHYSMYFQVATPISFPTFYLEPGSLMLQTSPVHRLFWKWLNLNQCSLKDRIVLWWKSFIHGISTGSHQVLTLTGFKA